MFNQSALAVAAGVCGAAFIGYCVYFDSKRRSHPDFKRKLMEKRNEEKKRTSPKVVFPDLRDVDAVQKFFLEEVQKGEELLALGRNEEGVDHLTNAVAVCGQPQQLLNVLKSTLPIDVFNMLVKKLNTIGERIASSPTVSAARAADKARNSSTITELSNDTSSTLAYEDDLE